MQDTDRQAKKRRPTNDKSFVDDGMTTSDIRKTIQQIRTYLEKGGIASLEDRKTQLKIDHVFFADRYPMLFEMSTRPDFSYEHLNYFLNKREEIINDQVSSEDASKTVGKEWFDKFVDVSKLEVKK
jgi:hypothetical protein